MFLEWWMIGILGLLWLFSLINHGNNSFASGCSNTIDVLQERGYIKVTESGDIIGLSNQNQENFDADQ